MTKSNEGSINEDFKSDSSTSMAKFEIQIYKLESPQVIYFKILLFYHYRLNSFEIFFAVIFLNVTFKLDAKLSNVSELYFTIYNYFHLQPTVYIFDPTYNLRYKYCCKLF